MRANETFTQDRETVMLCTVRELATASPQYS